MQYELLRELSPQKDNIVITGILANLPEKFNTLLNDHYQKAYALALEKLKNKGEFIWETSHEEAMIFIHLGDYEDYSRKTYFRKINDILPLVVNSAFKSLTMVLPPLPNTTPDRQLEDSALYVDSFFYQFLDLKTAPKKSTIPEKVSFYIPNAHQSTLHDITIIAKGIEFSRNLANLPANMCTPTMLGEKAQKLAERVKGLEVIVHDQKAIEKIGMNTLLAVAKGSIEEPRFIEVHYKNGGDTAPIVLVGKGITFDSGGLSLKPAIVMDEMKYDMTGGASVLGTLQACAELNLKINVIGLISSAENMPSGSAVKPGDVVKSLSGQYVEIINTDAEGRLVLCDALTYAERFNPKFVIDIATLTGAVIVALGHLHTGFMTKDEELATLINHAADTSQDTVWRLPLDEDYQEMLESPVADMLNATFDRTAGSVVAASFLARFTKKYRWAHLDIAGSAWIPGKKRNATGRPIPLLVEILRHEAKR